MPGLGITLLQQPLIWMDGPVDLCHFDRQLEEIIGRDVIVLSGMFTAGFAMEAAKRSLPEADVTKWMHVRAAQTQALIAGSAALQIEHDAVNRFLSVEPDDTVHHYGRRYLFRVADGHHRHKAGSRCMVFEWCGWRILPLACYDLRFPVWPRNLGDYNLVLYAANQPAPRSLHWQSLLVARVIEDQAYVADRNRVGADSNSHHYHGDSRIISPQERVAATTDPHQAIRLDAELSLTALQEYCEKFPTWHDTDPSTPG